MIPPCDPPAIVHVSSAEREIEVFAALYFDDWQECGHEKYVWSSAYISSLPPEKALRLREEILQLLQGSASEAELYQAWRSLGADGWLENDSVREFLEEIIHTMDATSEARE